MPFFADDFITIEARRLTTANAAALAEWCGAEAPTAPVTHILVPIWDGYHRCNVGDWVIQGPKSEFWAATDADLHAQYQEVTP